MRGCHSKDFPKNNAISAANRLHLAAAPPPSAGRAGEGALSKHYGSSISSSFLSVGFTVTVTPDVSNRLYFLGMSDFTGGTPV